VRAYAQFKPCLNSSKLKFKTDFFLFPKILNKLLTKITEQVFSTKKFFSKTLSTFLTTWLALVKFNQADAFGQLTKITGNCFLS
jgi:hypothetical protein